MMRRYLLLFVAMIVIGLVLARFRPAPDRAQSTIAVADEQRVSIAMAIRDGVVVPSRSGVEKGDRVVLTMRNRDAVTRRVMLAGYEDRIPLPALGPGQVWQGEFVADRPGDDFAWLVDGRPAGRLAVAGSHLVDGHR